MKNECNCPQCTGKAPPESAGICGGYEKKIADFFEPIRPVCEKNLSEKSDVSLNL